MLGPIVNPSFPKKQLVGVFNLELARLYGYLHQKTDKRYIVLHSLDGYDEVSLTGPFKMLSNKNEKMLFPEDLGFKTWPQEALWGGKTVEDSAEIFIQVLQREGTEAQNEVVTANAGLAIHCGMSVSIEDGIEAAKESLQSGKALQTFKKLLEV